jgi:tetratricopeptide (TPR) repeat protein
MKSCRAGFLGVVLLMGGLAIGTARAGVDEDAEAIYQDILQQTEQAHNEGQPARSSSDAAMMAGVKCQEMGAHKQALALFKLAISEDASNAEAYRRYGDYLIQYRGIVNPALYYKAEALIKKNPNEYSDETKKEIKRSLQILYRDARYGVPVFESMAVSLFVQPYVEYREDTASGTSLREQQEFYSHYSPGSLDYKIWEAQNGITYFSGQMGEMQEGIKYFSEQVKDNEEGMAYFQNLADKTAHEFAGWVEYIRGVFFSDQGRYPGDCEDLGILDPVLAGVTICGRRAATQEEINGYLQRVEDINGDKIANEDKIWRIRRDRSMTQDKIDAAQSNLVLYTEALENIAKEIPRRPKTMEYGAVGTLAFPAMQIPDLNLSARYIDVEDAQYIIDMHTERPAIGRSTWEIYRADFGKRYLLTPRWDTEPSISVEKRHAVLENQDTEFTQNRERIYEYGIRNGLTLSLPHKTFKLYAEATMADIESNPGADRFTGEQIFIDDAGNSQVISLRSSFYPASDELRFGQNRSTHLELGVRRVERVYRATDDAVVVDPNVVMVGADMEDIIPFVVLEPLGRFRGLFDCPIKYQFHQVKKSGAAGNYRIHVNEVTVVPTLVPVYRMYARDFVTGMEEMRIKFPLKGSWGTGDFDYYGAGVTAETRLVFRNSFAVKPALGVDYRIYPELDDDDDWGVFARLAVSM